MFRAERLSAIPANVDDAGHRYDRVIDWYKVAESKAQLILTVNGAFVTIMFGLLSGSVAELRRSSTSVGALTWLLLTLALTALCGSITAAALSLLSRHHHHIRHDFAQLHIDPDDESTYQAEALWYYGHLASLRWQGVQAMLRDADEEFEARVLTYNVHGLARTVLRKHRLINAGWLLTSASLLLLVAAGGSLLLHS